MKTRQIKPGTTYSKYAKAQKQINRLTHMGGSESRYMRRITVKKLKKELKEFEEMPQFSPKGKKLEERLNTFILNFVRKKSPKQCASAAENLMNNLQRTVDSMNRQVKDHGYWSLNITESNFVRIMEETRCLIREEKDGVEVLTLDRSKVPTVEDFLMMSEKYLKFKRASVKVFGRDMYEEAYGS